MPKLIERLARKPVVWLYASIFVTIAGCSQPGLFEPNRVDTQEQAGAANIAVTMVAPFEDFVRELDFKFNLEPKEAVSRVLPRTSILDRRLLEITQFAGQVAQGQAPQNGQLPDLPADPRLGRDVRVSQDRLPKDNELQQDPILNYTAATHLMHEVKLLEKSVQNAALARDHVPYVVRLQLNLIPYRRHQPYDYYATIGFFPVDRSIKTPLTKGVQVLPLLVTDNLEHSATQRTLDVVRQIQLAARLSGGGLLGQLGFSQYREDLQSILGSDHNSLRTIGRVTNNTIQIRLGARRQATAGYATVPQSHNITAILLVPRKLARKAGSGDGIISVNLNSVLRDADSGEELPANPENTREDELRRVLMASVRGGNLNLQFTEQSCRAYLKRLGFKSISECMDASGDEDKFVRALRGRIFSNDINGFDKLLKITGLKDRLKRSVRSLWLSMVETMGRHKFAAARFQLPRHFEPKLPPVQAVFFTDDGKSSMSATLSGGSSLQGLEIKADLELVADAEPFDKPIRVTALDARPSSDGKQVTVRFPSAKAYGFAGSDPAKTKMFNETAVLRIRLDSKHPWNKQRGRRAYRDIYYAAKSASAPAAPKFQVATNSKVIKSRNGQGSVTLFLDLNKKVFDVDITLDGGEIVGAHLEGNTASTLAVKKGKVTVSQTSQITLLMRNLDPAFGAKFNLKSKSNGNRATALRVSET